MFNDLAHQPEILTSDKKVEDKVEPKKTFEEMTPEERDAIIKPKHHTQALPNGIEFMDYMKHSDNIPGKVLQIVETLSVCRRQTCCML